MTLDWSQGKPNPIKGSEKLLEAQLVLVACGYSGPVRKVFDSMGVEMTDGPRSFPKIAAPSDHKTVSSGDVPIFAAGDSKNGATLVVNAMSDGLACAKEVAELLL